MTVDKEQAALRKLQGSLRALIKIAMQASVLADYPPPQPPRGDVTAKAYVRWRDLIALREALVEFAQSREDHPE